MSCKLNSKPFGIARSPADWARMTSSFSFILLLLCALWVAIYVEDCNGIEPKETELYALNALRGLAKTIGLVSPPGKKAGPTFSSLLLGEKLIAGETTHTRRIIGQKGKRTNTGTWTDTETKCIIVRKCIRDMRSNWLRPIATFWAVR